jgi:hypothetical protein
VHDPGDLPDHHDPGARPVQGAQQRQWVEAHRVVGEHRSADVVGVGVGPPGQRAAERLAGQPVQRLLQAPHRQADVCCHRDYPKLVAPPSRISGCALT